MFLDTWRLVLDSRYMRTHSLGEARDPMRKILGPEAGARLKPIWGLDAEGEIKGAWRDIGLPHLWCMIGTLSSCLGEGGEDTQLNHAGNFALCRYHSKHIALRALFHADDSSARTDSAIFSLPQKLKRSRKVCLTRRDIAWRHHTNERS